jgi:hypothetical protein
MSIKTDDLEISTVLLDFDSLKIVGENAKNYIALCPECINKKGSADKVGKLHITKDHTVGWCFRCITKFTNDISAQFDSENVDNYQFNKNISNLAKKFSSQTHEANPDKPELRDIFDLDDECRKALAKRNPYILLLVQELMIYKSTWWRLGIFIPFIRNGEIQKYQIRFLDKEVPKYYTSTGDKVLYSPRHLFLKKNPPIVDVITICEGVFDAIALCMLGYNAVAILGSSLTSIHIQQLRSVLPSKICLSMDSKSLNNSIRKQLLSAKLPSVARIVDIDLPGIIDGEDPEEYIVRNISDVNMKNSIMNNIIKWKSEYASRSGSRVIN